ncbi:hypothetical protein Smp_159000 [Schistosoma mansoni]|uniref:hypothetical protein n=1 Tax=Schistosoma mansoni TaxID=6183 RepID=UPI00022C82E9|nr:hypothetical protein Smp_159000 [Schistosoma mansoni]|eukprot:XP_018646818.1 hypothetical protein Smp_159000 [Schistosoma mansoni]
MFLDSDTENDVMQDTVVAFTSRHLTEAIEGQVLYREKYHKEKIKTLTVALVICLNIDIDPPDVQKIPPFSRVEAWVDPTDANSLHALGNIGKNLQAQYERWQPRARYKQCLDPTLDDVKKLCLSLRRNAKDDRILFHYNGHGVPRPTENGEIWVFNTKFTKYIPLSLYDLQRWLGAPTVYVLDCQNAGRIIHMYEVFCERRKAEAAVVEQRQMECDGKTDQSETSQYNHQSYSGSNCPNIPNQATLPSSSTVHVVSMENTFMLAACGKDEDLPQNPNLPADLFTACLTTPIRMALRWHWLRHQEYFPGYLDETLLDRIPGSHSNRMSLLGEINWIFTAVTDTIAWCSFPLDIFQKLFRQDLLIASLFRNFLLAERIMKYYGCHPISAPLLLPTYKHNMWDAWDHTVDRVIHYLPKMLKIIEGGSFGPSSFFTSQMTAFKIWLQTADERRPVATQLPILLQILLSQSHRIRAMQLLSEFLDLGPWAVAHCLTVGIFPYIVRLFHSPVSEVKPYLVFIWGKIIASAQTEFGRNDSVRDFGYKYFIACLSDTENLTPLTRTITAFALAKMLEKDESEEPDPFFQDVYLKQNFLPFVQTQLFDNTPTDNEEMLIRMRLWLILALAKLWCKNDEARWFGIRHNLPEVLLAYLNDISPEVRAATVYALGNLIENQTTDSSKQNHADQISHEIGGQLVKYSSRDACPLVRCMVVEAFRGLIKQFESQLCAIGIVTPPGGSGNGGSGSLHISRQLELTSNHINVHGSWFLTKSSNREVDPQHNYNYKTHLINTQSQASPILRKSVFNPGSAEFQAIVYNSPNNNDNNHKFITNDDTTLIPSLNTSLSALNASFTSSNTSTDNVSSTVNELNRAADNINSSRSENTFVKESSSNSITPITTTSGLQMTTTNPSSSSLIHSAQFPGRRYQQTDQRLRVSVTNSPQLPNTIMSNNTVTCGVPATTTTDNSGNNGNYPSSLDTVHTQFFAWSCRWFTRPLLSKYGQLNNGQSKSQTTSKNSFDYEPVSLGTISTDPKAVAYTDRVNRLKKQRKISHLGRLQWERIAGQISHSLVTSTINANTTTTTINRIISVYDCCLHPVAFYHHPLNHRINNSSNDTFCSISSQVKFHPYQPHLVMINSDRKGVVIHSTKNLKLLHSINTFSAKSSLFPEFPSTIDGYSRVGCVTDIEFINADEEESLLLTATDDGYIRIWRNYTHHLGQDPEILTAWNGITDLYQTDYPVGVVVHWSQHANQLMVSGDTRIIRIWDCLCESKLRDISTGSDTSVTCLTKSIDNHLLAAGFNDGGIRVWDKVTPRDCLRSTMSNVVKIPIEYIRLPQDCSIILIFNSQADTARIFKVVFSSTNRLYAVGAMGGIGAWHLSFPNENNNTTTPTTTTSNTSLLTTSLNSSNNGSSTRHDHNNLTNHPCRYISTVIRSSTNNSINNSSTTRRFRRLPCPPRLSLPMNSSVNCADLLVSCLKIFNIWLSPFLI